MRVVQRCISFSRPIYRNLVTSSSANYNVRLQDNVIKSPIPPVSVPNYNIEEFLYERVDRWPDKTAVVCSTTGRKYTFSQYQKLAENVAQGLCTKVGLRKGDYIAVLLPNVPEYVTIISAAAKAGIIITTINPLYSADEIAKQMIDSTAKAIITLTQTYAVAQEALKKIHSNIRIPIITVKFEQTDTTPAGALNFQELCEYNGPQIKLQSATPDDVALLCYSSGTSGLPKGVQLLHRNIVADLVQIQQKEVKLNYETTNSYQDVVPIVAPFFHCYGMIPILFNVFSEGCKSVILSKFQPNLYLDMLERYPPNLLHIVPPIVIMLINDKNAKKHLLERTRTIVSAAAPLADSDIIRFEEKFGSHVKLIQYYGLTETGPVTHVQRIDTEIVKGSVGCNLSLTESRVVATDDENKNLGPNEQGHLLIRGPQIMQGYYNNPKATAEAIDKDGWFKTGDIAYYSEDGLFFITDRMKELIKVKGFQVAPAELEALIRGHPDVFDVAITSVPHEQHGEAPKAFVVPRQNSNLKPEHVQKHVQERAAKYKHLTGGVVFVDAIPKNPSGKILRRLLKDM